MPFESRKTSRHFASILWNSLGITDDIAIGRKLLGWDGSPPLWMRVISAENQDVGPLWDIKRILENRVARKWWAEGRFLKWKYVIWSVPGEEDGEYFCSILFTWPGVMGVMSNSSSVSGQCITSSTQSGKFFLNLFLMVARRFDRQTMARSRCCVVDGVGREVECITEWLLRCAVIRVANSSAASLGVVLLLASSTWTGRSIVASSSLMVDQSVAQWQGTVASCKLSYS